MNAHELDRPLPLTTQIANKIRNEITSGLLKDGQVLPSTRELADQWDVSSYTISEAMKHLETDGLVATKNRSMRLVVAPAVAMETIKPSTATVVLVAGFAGSGKSQLGRILSRRTGWAVIDKDTITRPVVERALIALGSTPNDRESKTYVNEVRPREYEALLDAVTENVECGVSVIVAAPFIHELSSTVWIERTKLTLDDLNARMIIVWVDCDAKTTLRYLKRRGAERDEFKLANWDDYLESIDLDFRPKADHVVIHNSAGSEPLEKQISNIPIQPFEDAVSN